MPLLRSPPHPPLQGVGLQCLRCHYRSLHVLCKVASICRSAFSLHPTLLLLCFCCAHSHRSQIVGSLQQDTAPQPTACTHIGLLNTPCVYPACFGEAAHKWASVLRLHHISNPVPVSNFSYPVYVPDLSKPVHAPTLQARLGRPASHPGSRSRAQCLWA